MLRIYDRANSKFFSNFEPYDRIYLKLHQQPIQNSHISSSNVNLGHMREGDVRRARGLFFTLSPSRLHCLAPGRVAQQFPRKVNAAIDATAVWQCRDASNCTRMCTSTAGMTNMHCASDKFGITCTHVLAARAARACGDAHGRGRGPAAVKMPRQCVQ